MAISGKTRPLVVGIYQDLRKTTTKRVVEGAARLWAILTSVERRRRRSGRYGHHGVPLVTVPRAKVQLVVPRRGLTSLTSPLSLA